MATTVEITQGDDGSFTVGLVDQPSADIEDSQQVGSLAQALQMARQLLANPGAAAGSGGSSGAAAGGAAAAGDGSGGAGAGGPSAQDMWDQMAQQNTPPH